MISKYARHLLSLTTEKTWLWMIGICLILPINSFAEDPVESNTQLDLDEEGVTTLPTISVTAKRKRGKKPKNLDDSYIYNTYRLGDLSLKDFLERMPGMHNAPQYNNQYNLSYRGINTSPINNVMPMTFHFKGVTFDEGIFLPYHVYNVKSLTFNRFSALNRSHISTLDIISPSARLNSKVGTTDRSERNTGWLHGRFSPSQQMGSFGVAGSAKERFYYSLNLNFTNLPGTTRNRINRDNFQDKRMRYLDDHTSIFINGDLGFDISRTVSMDVYYLLSSQDRGLFDGYLTTEEYFNQRPGKDDIRAGQKSRFNSFIQDTTHGAGLDLTGYTNNYAWKLRASYMNQSLRRRQDLNRSETPVPQPNIFGEVNNQLNNNIINIGLSFEPIEPYIYGNFSLDLDYKYRGSNSPTNNILLDIDGGENSLLKDRIALATAFKGQQHHVTINNQYSLKRKGFSFIIGLEGRLSYYTMRSTSSARSLDNNGFGFIDLINLYLEMLGRPTYGSAPRGFDNSALNLSIHPSIAFHYSKNSKVSPKNIQEYYARYDQVIKRGGFNPFTGPGGSGRAYYRPSQSGIAELGGRWAFREGRGDIHWNAYFIHMHDIHHLYTKDLLSLDTHNIPTGYSFGTEFTYRHRFKPNIETELGATFTYAIYGNHKLKLGNAENTQYDFNFAGKMIPNTPIFTAHAGFSAWESRSGFYFYTEARLMGPHYFDPQNKLKSDPYIAWNARLGFEWRYFSIDMYVDNILNANHTVGALYGIGNNAGSAISGAIGGIPGVAFDWKNTANKITAKPLELGINFVIKW